MTVAALQLSTLPMSEAKLDYYFRICKQKEVEVVLLSEYALNSFFKELETMPTSMIKEQSNNKIAILKKLCAIYELHVIAPIVNIKGDFLYKTTAHFSPKSVHFFDQQFLINYKHWNEEKFFANTPSRYTLPLFLHNGLRFAIVSGYELHFDMVWAEVMKKNVDVVLVPSSSTFDSSKRWDDLLKMRAYLNNVYILRANRVGSFREGESTWKFYGHSNLVSPFGEIEVSLGDQEEMLVATIEKEPVLEARKLWGWKKQISKRDVV